MSLPIFKCRHTNINSVTLLLLDVIDLLDLLSNSLVATRATFTKEVNYNRAAIYTIVPTLTVLYCILNNRSIEIKRIVQKYAVRSKFGIPVVYRFDFYEQIDCAKYALDQVSMCEICTKYPLDQVSIALIRELLKKELMCEK